LAKLGSSLTQVPPTSCGFGTYTDLTVGGCLGGRQIREDAGVDFDKVAVTEATVGLDDAANVDRAVVIHRNPLADNREAEKGGRGSVLGLEKGFKKVEEPSHDLGWPGNRLRVRR
jgi:hypothetical protein